MPDTKSVDVHSRVSQLEASQARIDKQMESLVSQVSLVAKSVGDVSSMVTRMHDENQKAIRDNSVHIESAVKLTGKAVDEISLQMNSMKAKEGLVNPRSILPQLGIVGSGVLFVATMFISPLQAKMDLVFHDVDSSKSSIFNQQLKMAAMEERLATRQTFVDKTLEALQDSERKRLEEEAAFGRATSREKIPH